MDFADFLELPEDKRLEQLFKTNPKGWHRTYIKCLNKWWTSIQDANPHLKGIALWESLYKGRF